MRVIDHRHAGRGQVAVEPGLIRPTGTDDWSARVTLLQTDGVRVDAMTLSPHLFRCGPGADGFRPSIAVAWVREGHILGTSGPTVFEVQPGEALLWDTRYPLESHIEQDLRLLRVIVDLADLPEHLAASPPEPAAVLRSSPVVRSTLAFAGTLLQETRRTEPEDDPAVATRALIALVIGLIAELEHQQRAAMPPEHRDRRAAIEAHIAARLADPGLGPVSIGRDFGISVRSVHAAFAGSGSTVAAEIRSRRVAAVQRTLHGRQALPRMAELAAQHGFHDASQLSRTFRDVTGTAVRNWFTQTRP